MSKRPTTYGEKCPTVLMWTVDKIKCVGQRILRWMLVICPCNSTNAIVALNSGMCATAATSITNIERTQGHYAQSFANLNMSLRSIVLVVETKVRKANVFLWVTEEQKLLDTTARHAMSAGIYVTAVS